MALIATSGASNSNSFLTVARAEEIAAEHPFSAPWLAIATTPAKEASLIMASRVINYSLCYSGSPTFTNQSLKFPRLGLIGSSGGALDSAIIPLELELATFEMALALISSNVTTEKTQSVEGLIRLKAGPVELGFKNDIQFSSVPANVKAYIPTWWLCPEISKPVEFNVF